MTANDTGLVAIGIDGAQAGWVAALLREDGSTELRLFSHISDVEAATAKSTGVSPVAVDIPIGLPDAIEYRGCDIEARKRLGARAQSVFAVPARKYLAAGNDYGAVRSMVAQAKLSDPTARGMSAQAAALIPKIAEVDEWLREDRGRSDWLFECHPELAFLRLNGGKALDSKSRPAGAVSRLRLVRQAFPDAEERIEAFSQSKTALADVLDAYAALSVAWRWTSGQCETIGDGRLDGARLPMRMVI